MATPRLANDIPTDEHGLAARVARGDHGAFEALMRQHNSRLFRVARAIVKDESEAEDVLQDAYLNAYRRIREFRGEARMATWLTRIVINQALMRLRRQRRERVVVPFLDPQAAAADEPHGDIADRRAEPPVNAALRAEIRRMLELKIDGLPVAFRTVFVMREVEDMTVEETAACLSIPEATVRTRLFRARTLLREALARDLDAATLTVFNFAGARCDRIVEGVLSRVSEEQHNRQEP